MSNALNVALIDPSPNDDFANTRDHRNAMTLYELESAIQNFEDAVSDPANRDDFILEYRRIADMRDRFTNAIELMWRVEKLRVVRCP